MGNKSIGVLDADLTEAEGIVRLTSEFLDAPALNRVDVLADIIDQLDTHLEKAMSELIFEARAMGWGIPPMTSEAAQRGFKFLMKDADDREALAPWCILMPK